MKGFLLNEDEFQTILQEFQEIKSLLKQTQKNQAQNGKLLNVKEVAQILNVTTRTLQTWRDQNLISFIQIGGKVLFRTKDVDDFLMSYHIKRKGGES